MGARSDERGVAMVEFALVMVMLLTLLFGIVEFGMGYFRYQGLQAAAREGARVAVVTPPATREQVAEARTRDALRGVIPDPQDADIEPEDACEDEDRFVVSVSYEHGITFPFLPVGPITLSSTAEFRCEWTD